jgi:hypothetical protein
MSCSFCNLRGHNITTCNDIFIDIHYERIKNIYIDIITRIYPDNIENYTELGKSQINTLFDLKKLRAVGVKYLHLNARMNKSQLIPRIWEHFKTHIYYPPPLSEEETVPLEALIDRTQSQLLMRFDNDEIISGMMPYYMYDSDFVNTDFVSRGFVRNMGLELEAEAEVEALLSEAEAEVEAQLDMQTQLEAQLEVQLEVEAQAEARRYNIMPIFVFKDENDDDEGTEMDCPICYESIKCVDLIKLNCSHRFCGLCLKSILERHNITHDPKCALCREDMCSFDIQNPEIYNLVAKFCIRVL